MADIEINDITTSVNTNYDVEITSVTSVEVDVQYTSLKSEIVIPTLSTTSVGVDYFYPQGPAGINTWGTITGTLSNQTDLWNALLTASGGGVGDAGVNSLVRSNSGFWNTAYISTTALNLSSILWNDTFTSYVNTSSSFTTKTDVNTLTGLLTPLTVTNTLTSLLVKTTDLNTLSGTLLTRTDANNLSSLLVLTTDLNTLSGTLLTRTDANTLTGKLVTITSFTDYQTNVGQATATLLAISIYQNASGNWQKAYDNAVFTINGTNNQIIATKSTTSPGSNTYTLSLPTSAVFPGDVTINGNLVANGSATYINTNNLIVGDNIIYLNDKNTGNSLDTGFVSHFTPTGGNYNHTGLIRKSNQGIPGIWTLFSGLTTEPLTASNIDWNDKNIVIDSLSANLIGNVTGNVSGNAGTVTNGVYTTDTGTVTNTMLAGNITDNKIISSGKWNDTNTNVVGNSSVWSVGGVMPIGFTTNSTVGGITQNTVFSVNTPLSTIIQRLLVAAIPYQYIYPTLTVSTTAVSFEVGTNITSLITGTYIQNDAGAVTIYQALSSFTGTNYRLLTSINVSNFNTVSSFPLLAPYYLLSSTNFILSAAYGQGPIRNDNYGNPTPGNLSAAALSSTNFIVISAFRNAFFTSDNATTSLSTSNIIRGLTGVRQVSANDFFSITAFNNSSRFGIAYPSNYKLTLSSTQGYDIATTYFAVSTVSVSGANNLSPINYRVFTYKGSVPATLQYNISSSQPLSANPATPIAPSLAIGSVTYNNYEVGSLQTGSVTVNYNTGTNYGNYTGIYLLTSSNNSTYTATSSTPVLVTGYTTPSFTVTDVTTNVYVSGVASYGVGPQLYSNYNDIFGTPTAAGSAGNFGTITINPFRKAFYGGSALQSAQLSSSTNIRGLDRNVDIIVANGFPNTPASFNLTNTTSLAFAAPTAYPITITQNGTYINPGYQNNVASTAGAFNFNTSNFTVSTISVSGANNLYPTPYRVLIYRGTPPNVTYQISILNSTTNVTSPTYVPPTIGSSSNTSYISDEVGTLESVTITSNYSPNDGGTYTSYNLLTSTDSTNYTSICAINNPANVVTPVYSFYQPATNTTLYFKSSAVYGTGYQKYTNYNDLSGLPVQAGSKTDTSASITLQPFRYSYYILDNKRGYPNNSALIRSLALSAGGVQTTSIANGGSFTITTAGSPNGTQRIFIAYPATINDIASINNIATGDPILNNFNNNISYGLNTPGVPVLIPVTGANNLFPTNYKTYFYEPNSAFSSVVTYRVTIS